MRERALPPRLIGLTPGDLAAGDVARFAKTAGSAIEAGLACILLREPVLGDRATLELARELRALLGNDGYLVVHDRVHLADACRANAVHLGWRSLTPNQARPILPDEIAIGFSAHESDDEAQWRDADYLFFGPVLATASKSQLKAPVGFDGLRRAVERSPAPIWALGGLAPEHAHEALGSGARGIAVLSGIFGAQDPAAASRRYLHALARA